MNKTDYNRTGFFGDLERWKKCEEKLLDDEVPIPLSHRSSWIKEMVSEDVLFVELRNTDDGSLSAALPIFCSSTRSLPGHYRLRATRFGYAVESRQLPKVLQALSSLTDERARFLSLNVEIFATDDDHRTFLEHAAGDAGYREEDRQRRYRHTVGVDLTPDEEDIIMSFSKSCRQSIRNPEKKGFRVKPLSDERWAGRMDELWAETFARTGATPPPKDWADHLQFARRYPDLYRIIGTFSPEFPADDSLVGFSCARNNGDHAAYADGASTRDVESGVSLTYAPLWELMRWAKTQSCSWFDMGGISPGSYEDDEDPRGGISDFKRRFTENVITVGTEWTYRPDSFRTNIADAVSRSATAVRELLSC